ncbi:MAG: transposase [Elusimicrobia bacterium]|nr:transposase [Elusimicrobiota bacterium]
MPAPYRPRRAPASPLYRLLQEHLETFLALHRPSDAPAHPDLVERALRAFLECGVHRFGLVRFRCHECGESLFVAFSCKRRLTCPSCDGKRAALTADHALESLLPDAPYRQWVLVVPKRLRWFLHRAPAAGGELARILAGELGRYYSSKCGEGSPAQIHFLQRFGSVVNLHLHDHAVTSDGAFRLSKGRLDFVPAGPPTAEEAAAVAEAVRRKALRRFARMGVVPRDVAEDLLCWERSGFSLHSETVVPRGDREALRRLLFYCARPAFSVRRLEYHRAAGQVVYDARDKRLGRRRLTFTALEFIGRVARLVPPPRANLVRYYGALGPNSPLRPHLRTAAEALSATGLLERTARAAGKVVGACSRAWARCLSKVFEVDPLVCARCGGRLEPVAVIVSDLELPRVLEFLGLPVEFPVLKPSRSPPVGDEESQLAPGAGLCDGVDWAPPDDGRQVSYDE